MCRRRTANPEITIYGPGPVTAADTRTPAVVIVDGFFAPGRALAQRFRMQGVTCIGLVSQGRPARDVLEIPGPQDPAPEPLYALRIVFDGNHDAVIRALAPYTIIGIVPGSGTGVSLADELSERMDLLSNGTRWSAARLDRFQIQHALIDAGVPVKPFICTADEADAVAWFRSGRFRSVVVRPVRSTAVRGAAACSSEEEIHRAFEDLRRTTREDGDPAPGFLIEENPGGTEFLVTTVSRDGQHRLAGIWEYRKADDVRADEVQPGGLSEDRIRELTRYTSACLDALGIRYGAAQTAILMAEEGPFLIESRPWLMDGTISPGLILRCPGTSQADLLVGAYCDPERFLCGDGTSPSPEEPRGAPYRAA